MPLSLPDGPGNPGNGAKRRTLAPGTLPTAASRGSGRTPGQPTLPCVWQPGAVPGRHSVGQPTAQVQDAGWPVLLPRGPSLQRGQVQNCLRTGQLLCLGRGPEVRSPLPSQVLARRAEGGEGGDSFY